MSRTLLIGIVLGLVLAYVYHAFLVPSGAPAFPIVISYDRAGAPLQMGQARDRLGIPFNNTNPGR